MRFLNRFGLKEALTLVVLVAILSIPIGANAYSSKSNNGNSVRVDVKPVLLTPGEPAKFQVRMNTHTVDLSEDMVAVSTLEDDQGRSYQPTNWEGSGPGGHHRSGTLVFPALEGSPKSVTLVIREIANVSQRTFEWEIK
ncbi:MAG: hypothetical protein MUO52_07655 [Desulfobacterales bacterium]|nr:hypothetical protein [Desulfobacterales bacterium]